MRRQESEMRPTRIFLQSVLLSALLGGSADAQALLGPLHRPASAEIETPSPMPASFKLGVSTPGPYRLGALRKTELDAVVRQPQLPLVGIERSLDAAPQALLRPVVQDSMLPTVASIGGPAELAYLAQSEVLYRAVLGRMPVALPRAGFTILDAQSEKLMERYGLALQTDGNSVA